VGVRQGDRSWQGIRWRARRQTESALPRVNRRFRSRAPMIEGGSPPPMVVVWERGHGVCCVVHMKDPPSRMQMGPQRAVADIGNSKSDVDSSEGIHAIQLSSLTHVLKLLLTSSCPRCPHHQLSLYSYFSTPHFLENRESRNSCRVKVNGVHRGHDDVRKSWSTCARLKDRISCMALPCQRQILKCQHLLPPTSFGFFRGDPSYEGALVSPLCSQSQSERCDTRLCSAKLDNSVVFVGLRNRITKG